MNKPILVKAITQTSQLMMVLAAGITIPILCHMAHLRGDIFLPIFTAILVAGYQMDFKRLLTLAIVTPITNMMLTGMPISVPIPMLQVLTLELVVFALSLKLGARLPIWLNGALSLTMARISSAGLIFIFNSWTFPLWKSHFILGIPGMILNILILTAWYKIHPIESQCH